MAFVTLLVCMSIYMSVPVAVVFGLMLCIVRVAKARRAGLSEEGLRAVVQSVVPLNLGALFLSVAGLMMVVIGVFLG